jgi:hypothetical protein
MNNATYAGQISVIEQSIKMECANPEEVQMLQGESLPLSESTCVYCHIPDIQCRTRHESREEQPIRDGHHQDPGISRDEMLDK